MLAPNSSSNYQRGRLVPKILIVEDDMAIREAFSIVLSSNPNYQVVTAENGQVALHLCQQDTFDLILLDIMMPVMDGPTFLKEYIARFDDDPTKIIIMSNLSSGSELSMAQDFGVSRLVLKSSLTPFELHSLVKTVLHDSPK